MKICKVCLQSDILCNACSRKLEEGKISKTDIDISRAIHKLNKEKDIDADFLHVIESRDRIFVIVESRHAARFIGPGGRNVKKLSELLGKPVKMLEKAEGDDRHVIEKLIGAPVIGINKVYSGGESLKVRIERRYMRIAPLEPVVSKIIGKKVGFVFE